jgi:hypothetical protein
MKIGFKNMLNSAISNRRAWSRISHRRRLMRCPPVQSELRSAGPQEPPPKYSEIDRNPVNKVIMGLFRSKMVAAIGRDSNLEGYDAIIDLTRVLNRHEGVLRSIPSSSIMVYWCGLRSALALRLKELCVLVALQIYHHAAYTGYLDAVCIM